MTTVHTSSIQSLPLLARGKVRDNYAVGDDRILMVASDRLSAFDVIMGEPIPGKGEILTQMALFWFDRLGHLCPNHLTGDAPESVVTPEEVPQVTGPLHAGQAAQADSGRSRGARLPGRQRLEGIPGERGPSAACRCRAGLQQREQAAAADLHARGQGGGGRARREHQLRARWSRSSGRRSRSRSARPASRIYEAAAAIALAKGMIIADTKFEFGLDEAGTLVLMDEVLTPDSLALLAGRRLRGRARGRRQPAELRQAVRARLARSHVRINGKPWDKTPPAPRLPADVIEKTAAKYREALQRLTG